MNLNFAKPILAAGLVLTLGACAALTPSESKADRFSRIHSGLTQDEVRQLAGTTPDTVTQGRNGDALWIYHYEDLWGYDAELDVEFQDGVVRNTFSEHVEG